MKPSVEFRHRFDSVVSRIMAGDEPAWLREQRGNAYDRFQKLGLPTTDEEDWKYTSLAGVARMPFEAESPGRTPPQPAAKCDWADAHHLVFVDGRFDPSQSILRAPEPGVTLMPLAEAVRLGQSAASEVIGHLDENMEALDALNTALWRDGLYLSLERGVHLGRPLVVQSISTAGRLVPVRHLLVLGDGAQATVIEHYVSAQAGTHFTNAVTECLLGTGARLTHVRLQDEHGQAFHTARIVARQGRGSHWINLSLAAGGALTRNDIVSQLQGEGASCMLNGLTLGAGRRHTDHHLFVDHRRPGGISEQHYRGIAAGRSRIVFNGRIRVAPGASKTDARQLNRNLLLSREAEVDSKPQLEIYNNDVKCSHGAATGGLDEAQLFYLRSRGLPKSQARAMLIEAFAVSVLDAIADQALRESLVRWVRSRLPELTGDE